MSFGSFSLQNNVFYYNICFDDHYIFSLDDEEEEDEKLANETLQDEDEEIPNLVLRDDGFYVVKLHVAR